MPRGAARQRAVSESADIQAARPKPPFGPGPVRSALFSQPLGISSATARQGDRARRQSANRRTVVHARRRTAKKAFKARRKACGTIHRSLEHTSSKFHVSQRSRLTVRDSIVVPLVAVAPARGRIATQRQRHTHKPAERAPYHAEQVQRGTWVGAARWSARSSVQS